MIPLCGIRSIREPTLQILKQPEAVAEAQDASPSLTGAVWNEQCTVSNSPHCAHPKFSTVAGAHRASRRQKGSRSAPFGGAIRSATTDVSSSGGVPAARRHCCGDRDWGVKEAAAEAAEERSGLLMVGPPYSQKWGYVRIIAGTILGGVLGFYVMHRVEISYKEKMKERLRQYEIEMERKQQQQKMNELEDSA
ncbi:uncharacterized protein LOC104427777 [Eucalyptus grandis]|uniref:uncharacterized protein LOC104427777 n=1 Tax=Eucalyptus grandis TaxID=71139 RepID=UPI00192E9FFB|nr:uncharacterized protein LOC104427777 [Eucalyptus grandis]